MEVYLKTKYFSNFIIFIKQNYILKCLVFYYCNRISDLSKKRSYNLKLAKFHFLCIKNKTAISSTISTSLDFPNIAKIKTIFTTWK